MSPVNLRTRSMSGSERSDRSAYPGQRQPVRVLLIAALAPLIITYVAVAAVLALVSAIASHATFSAVDTLRAAGPAMLTVYQVPVEIAHAPLGVLPLLPTIGVFFLVRRAASGAAHRLDYREPQQVFVVVGAIAGMHAAAGGLLAAATAGSAVTVTPLTALLVPGVVTGVAALFGAAPVCGVTTLVRHHLDTAVAGGVRAGVLGIAALLTMGCALFAVGTVGSFDTARELFAGTVPGAGGGVGMLLLSAGYLPNVVVGSTSMVLGPGFSLGELSAGPFGFAPGPLPGVPLLASVPESAAQWWPLLLALPLACGILVGFAARRVAVTVGTRLRTVLIAGVVVALAMVLLAVLAGGQLGAGPLSPAEVPIGWFSLAGFGWIVVPGSVTTWLAGPHRTLRNPLARAAGAVTGVANSSSGAPSSHEGAAEDAADETGQPQQQSTQ